LERIKIENNKETNTDFVKLFDGNLKGWNLIGNGSFEIILENVKDKKQHPLLMTQGDMGLLWYYKKNSKTLSSCLNGVLLTTLCL